MWRARCRRLSGQVAQQHHVADEPGLGQVHAVVRVEGPERIAMEWWKQDGKRLTRDYFRIEDAEGLRFWIFRDGLYESELRDEEGKFTPANWFVHGLFA